MRKQYEISSDEPKCYPMLLERFGGRPWLESDDCITYDGVIYSRHHPLPPDVLEHELVHIRQQAIFHGGAISYLLHYCADMEFRKWQEVEAYKAQLRFIRRHVDRNTADRAQQQLAHDLATMYELGISQQEALELL